jgi:WD40 repeat protein
VALTDDGATLATGEGDGTIELWDVSSGRRIAALKGAGAASLLRFSHDGRFLAAIDPTLELWDLQRRALVGSGALYPGSPPLESPIDLEFSATGDWLLTPGLHGRGMVWDLDASSWQLQVCGLLAWRPTRTEWHDFVGTSRYDPAC